MTDDPKSLDRLLDQLGTEGRRQPDPVEHPSSGTLSAYHAGELTSEQELQVQEHLAACKRCRELLLDFASFVETPLDEPREGVSDLEAAREWRALQERMGPAAAVSPVPRPRNFRQGPFPTIAASLLVTVLAGSLIGVSWSNAKLRSQLAELRAPRADVVSARLEGTRGGALSIPSGKAADLEISTSAPAEFAEYQIEITGEEGRILWSQQVAKGPGNPRLLLSPGFLEPGLYHVRLSGIQGVHKEPLESYTLRLEP